MQYYYEIEEAWKLYVNQGVVKAESLNPSLLRMWEISKISGAKYNKPHLSLSSQQGFVSKLQFHVAFETFAMKYKLSLYLADSKCYVHDVCGLSFENIRIPIGAKLNIENAGYTSFHRSLETNEITSLNYSENFVLALHNYETQTHPFRLNDEEYYIFVLSNKQKIDAHIEHEIAGLINDLIREKKKPRHTEEYRIRDFIPLFELGTDGIITKRLSNTKFNKYFEENTNLSYEYNLFNLDEILRGGRQYLVFKREKNKYFLLSPIKWISDNSILCQAEELKESYRAFFEVEKELSNEPFLYDLPKDLERRILSLSVSKYPSFLIYKQDGYLSFIFSLISHYQDGDNITIFYAREEGLVKELCELQNSKRRILPHDYKKVCYHIIVNDTGDENQKQNLSRFIRSATQFGSGEYKLIFYFPKNLMEEIRTDRNNETAMMDMQTIDFTSPNLEKTAEEYYRRGVSPEDRDEKRWEAGRNRNGFHAAVPEKAYSIKEAEKKAILDALSAASFNISEASKRLGISRAGLYRKMKLYKIDYRNLG